jgi:glycosyltransferase involved in cell wall biosynthesis
MTGPLVTCIMPTADRHQFVPRAVAQFLRQDYANRELIVLDDGAEPVGDLMPDDSRIRYVRDERRAPIGVKRNRACELARGDVIVHWDDDDWSAPWRVRYQVEQLLAARADACGLDRPLFYDPAERKAWQYVYPANAAPWVYGATLCYTKAFWRRNPFPPIGVGEDSRFVWASVSKKVLALDDPTFFVGIIHAANTSRKQTCGYRWRSYPVAAVDQLMAVSEVSNVSDVSEVSDTSDTFDTSDTAGEGR